MIRSKHFNTIVTILLIEHAVKFLNPQGYGATHQTAAQNIPILNAHAYQCDAQDQVIIIIIILVSIANATY